MASLELEAQRLLQASLAMSSHVTYRRGVNNFEDFRVSKGINGIWPAPSMHLIAFIAHMSLQGMASSTIDTYVSAVAYVHKVNNWVDPSDNFVVRKLREGCRRQYKQEDGRRPITIPILRKLSLSLSELCSSSYETCLFRAAFFLAFYAFLRVGEFTIASKRGLCSDVLLIGDVNFVSDHSALRVTIRGSKTDQRGVGVQLLIEAGADPKVCPVKVLSDYMDVRPGGQGPFFVHFGGEALTRYQFNSMLKKGILAIGLQAGDFSSHSFRIGAATSAALGGISTEQIMIMGRWRSSAVNSYIRPLRTVIPKAWF